MPLIIIIALCVALKLLDVWKFAELSWWAIAGLMLVAFIWFEFIEKMLGLDKKKQHSVNEERRKQRVAQSFSNKK